MGRHPSPIRSHNPLIRAVFIRADELGLSVGTLADLAGYDRAIISRLRSGAQPSLRLDTLLNLAEAVGLELTIGPKQNAKPRSHARTRLNLQRLRIVEVFPDDQRPGRHR